MSGTFFTNLVQMNFEPGEKIYWMIQHSLDLIFLIINQPSLISIKPILLSSISILTEIFNRGNFQEIFSSIFLWNFSKISTLKTALQIIMFNLELSRFSGDFLEYQIFLKKSE